MSNSRARKRAIRRLSERYDIPYSVAARRVELGGIPGDQGRTVYPVTSDTYRRQAVASRHRQPHEQRVRETRIGARLPDGRAQHLAARFPPTRGEPGTGVGGLYHGEHRVEALTRLYAAAATAQPGLVPSAGDLAWAAELGEETALDSVCFALDRAARLHAETNANAGTATPGLAGARQILDALLTIADDGHAPGTRVCLVDDRRMGTIVNVCWERTGPPIGYVVRLDGTPEIIRTQPRELVVLSGAEPY
ncbi:hypothetical protein [Flindersiella endophytica]